MVFCSPVLLFAILAFDNLDWKYRKEAYWYCNQEMFRISLSTWKQKLFRFALRRFGGHASVFVATLMGPPGPQNSLWPIYQIKHLPVLGLMSLSGNPSTSQVKICTRMWLSACFLEGWSPSAAHGRLWNNHWVKASGKRVMNECWGENSSRTFFFFFDS